MAQLVERSKVRIQSRQNRRRKKLLFDVSLLFVCLMTATLVTHCFFPFFKEYPIDYVSKLFNLKIFDPDTEGQHLRSRSSLKIKKNISKLKMNVFVGKTLHIFLLTYDEWPFHLHPWISLDYQSPMTALRKNVDGIMQVFGVTRLDVASNYPQISPEGKSHFCTAAT